MELSDVMVVGCWFLFDESIARLYFSFVVDVEEGTLLLQHLETLTGTRFSAPTHIAPTYRQSQSEPTEYQTNKSPHIHDPCHCVVTSEWLGLKPGELPPPVIYFDQNKLNAWANMAEHVQVGEISTVFLSITICLLHYCRKPSHP